LEQRLENHRVLLTRVGGFESHGAHGGLEIRMKTAESVEDKRDETNIHRGKVLSILGGLGGGGRIEEGRIVGGSQTKVE
jgi:hypothetical protein